MAMGETGVWNQSFFDPAASLLGASRVNPDSPVKRHAACDECRKRKLKCSGESAGCSRCIKQQLPCHYSLQKQMGRPPKKRQRGNSEGSVQELSGDGGQTGYAVSSGAEAYRLTLPVYCAPIGKLPQDISHLLPANCSWQTGFRDLDSAQSNAAQWPDFSTVSASAGPCPLPALPGNPEVQSLPLSPPNSETSTASMPCSCLSYLYLCLSHLSSITSFPISQNTLSTLSIAAKTAREVIRCQTCPLRFATGMQNVMFTGTLLSIIADSWRRVSTADAQELGMQAATPAYIAYIMQNSDNPAESWKQWLREVVRSAVIGGPIDPNARRSSLCSDAPDLLSLIREMEARQRRWHSRDGDHHASPLISRKYESCKPVPYNGNEGHSDQNHPSAEPVKQNSADKDFLCLRVLGSAREVISMFRFLPHEYPDGVMQ